MPQRKDYALSTTQRSDAREALRILDGSGLTLTDAAKRRIDAAMEFAGLI